MKRFDYWSIVFVLSIVTLALLHFSGCAHRMYPTRAQCRVPCSKSDGNIHGVASGDFATCVSRCTQVECDEVPGVCESFASADADATAPSSTTRNGKPAWEHHKRKQSTVAWRASETALPCGDPARASPPKPSARRRPYEPGRPFARLNTEKQLSLATPGRRETAR